MRITTMNIFINFSRCYFKSFIFIKMQLKLEKTQSKAFKSGHSYKRIIFGAFFY